MVQRWVQRIDLWQRGHRWMAFPFGVMKKFGDDKAGSLAALIAYYSFFSIFPLLLAFTTILGRVLEGNPDLQKQLLDSALGQFPVIGDQLSQNPDGVPGSGIALAVGLAGAVWGGLGAVMAMQNAMNGAWNVPLRQRPNFVKSRLRSLAMLAVFGMGVVALTVASSAVAAAPDIPVLGNVLAFAVAFGLGFLLYLAAFKLLTDADIGWGDLVPGALGGALAWAVLQVVGSAFVQRIVKGAESTAGVFAVVIGLLSWLYLLAQLTVMAAEINVVKREHLWPRSLSGRDLTDGDQRALARYAAVEQRVEGQDVLIDLRPPAVAHWVRHPARSDEAAES